MSATPDDLQHQLALAQARSRLQGRLLGMRHLDELRTDLSQVWLAELRGLGVPAQRMSLQWPADDPEHYVTHGTELFYSPAPRLEPMGACPWVRQAWDEDRPVRVDRAAMRAHGFDSASQAILETPLPGGGSLGLGSDDPDAFDAGQVDVVAQLAVLIPEAIHRVHELEVLQQAQDRARADLAAQRVRAAVLAMQDPDDWAGVVRATAQAIRPLLPFWSCSINLVDLEADALTAFGIDGEGGLERHVIHGVHPAVRRCLDSGQPVYRRSRRDPLFDPGFIARLNCVVDVPFPGGTLAVNAEAQSAFTDDHVALLQRLAGIVAEGHLRLRDLESLRQREAQLLQGRLLESLGQLAGGVAHQLNNPLMAVIGYAELLLRRFGDDDEARTALETIIGQGQRAHRIAERLVDFARRQRGPRGPLPLNPLVTEAVELLGPPASGAAVDLDLDAAVPRVDAQPGQIQQLVIALVDNALAQPSRRVQVRTRRAGAGVRIEVTDDGGGVPANVRPRMFDPFFTTRLEINSVGLGLSFAHRIATEHGGLLWHEDVPGGARFVVEIPAVSSDGN